MKKVAVAGAGAIGSAVCRALVDGIEEFSLVAASTLDEELSRRLIDRPNYSLPFLPLADLAQEADWIVEALPASSVPALVGPAVSAGKTVVMISSAALLLFPDLLQTVVAGPGRVMVPSGALAGMDGINALAEQGVQSARLITSKPPRAYAGAPYIEEQKIELSAISEPVTIFEGNALEAAAAFPANVNVAATLTVASRLAPEDVKVEVRADSALTANCHEVIVEGGFSSLRFKVENKPDPANPKSSALTALSIIALLRRQHAGFWVG